MTRVLITGASGFVGSHCLRELVSRGSDIYAVGRTAPGQSQKGVVWLRRDLRDPEQAVDIVAKVRPDFLLHCAWIATPGVYASSPENVDWLQSTAAMAVAFGAHGGRRFVGIGTSAEYDSSDEPCLEDKTPIRPHTIYGKCKAASWLAIQAAAQQHGFSAAWGRLFLPYGPGDSPHRLIPTVINSILAGKPVNTTGGLQKRDFIYAPDAGALFAALLFSEETGEFNVGSGQGSTVREVVEYVAAACGNIELVHFGARPTPHGDPPTLVAEMNKTRVRTRLVRPDGHPHRSRPRTCFKP